MTISKNDYYEFHESKESLMRPNDIDPEVKDCDDCGYEFFFDELTKTKEGEYLCNDCNQKGE